MITADLLHWSSHDQENALFCPAMVQMTAKDGILEGYLCATFLLAAQDMVEIRFLFVAQQQDLAAVIAHDEDCRILWPFSKQQGKSHIDTRVNVGKSHETK